MIGLSSVKAADYTRMFIDQVLDRAALIGVGEVLEVGDSTVVVEVEQVLKGVAPSGPLRMKQFVDWPCATRWTSYATGQRAIFCLESRHGLYQTVGAGNEGEFPIVDGRVYFITYLSDCLHEAIGREKGYAFNLAVAIEGIQKYLQMPIKEMIADQTVLGFWPDNAFLQKAIASIWVHRARELDVTPEQRTRIYIDHLRC